MPGIFCDFWATVRPWSLENLGREAVGLLAPASCRRAMLVIVTTDSVVACKAMTEGRDGCWTVDVRNDDDDKTGQPAQQRDKLADLPVACSGNVQ